METMVRKDGAWDGLIDLIYNRNDLNVKNLKWAAEIEQFGDKMKRWTKDDGDAAARQEDKRKRRQGDSVLVYST